MNLILKLDVLSTLVAAAIWKYKQVTAASKSLSVLFCLAEMIIEKPRFLANVRHSKKYRQVEHTHLSYVRWRCALF